MKMSLVTPKSKLSEVAEEGVESGVAAGQEAAERRWQRGRPFLLRVACRCAGRRCRSAVLSQTESRVGFPVRVYF